MPSIALIALLAVSPASASVLADDGMTNGKLIGSDLLLGTCLLLIMLAAFLLVGIVNSRREARSAARIAREQARRMNELLRAARLAENLADIGVWICEPATGKQQWSDGMRRIFGIDHDEPMGEGDAETLLHANNVNLIEAVREHACEDKTYSLHYQFHGFDGVLRAIKVQACNLKSGGNRPDKVVAVVQEETRQIDSECELESAREVSLHDASRVSGLAQTDMLTGLADRRTVMSQLDTLIMDARREERPLIIMVFGIDRLESVIDTHGDAIGDKVLQNVARIASAQARAGDIIGRIGGKEFVWVAPSATEAMGRVMSEKLREAVEMDSALASAGGNIPGVTISVGLTELFPGDTSLSLFARVDCALYEAKGAGRNRVQLAA